MKNEQILEKVISIIPYPNQITDVDLTTSYNAIRFTWRGDRFRVSENLNVEQVDRGLLMGTNAALLLSTLLK